MKTFSTTAIVLRTKKFGEKDQMVTLLTPKRGKVRAISKGSCDPKAKQCGVISSFNYVSLQIYEGRSIPIITQAQLLKGEECFLGDLKLFTLASVLCELVDLLTQEEQEVGGAFLLLKKTLEILPQIKRPEFFVEVFKVKLLHLLGYFPSFRKCVDCEEVLSEQQNNYFVSESHGFVCEGCGGSENDNPVGTRHGACLQNSTSVSFVLVKLFNFLQSKNLEDILKIKIKGGELFTLQKINTQVLQGVLGRELNTEKFLARTF